MVSKMSVTISDTAMGPSAERKPLRDLPLAGRHEPHRPALSCERNRSVEY
jgi:hypothetical protein